MHASSHSASPHSLRAVTFKMGNPRTDVSVFKIANYVFLGNRQEIQINIVTFCSPNGTFYLNTYLLSFLKELQSQILSLE